MRQTLLPIILIGACGLANAQSGVTIYGIADVGVTSTSGLRNGTLRQVSSGIMDGSRLGVKGSEDLGGGWRALFAMEHRMEMDTGGLSNRPASGAQMPDRLIQAAVLGLPGAFQPVVTAVASSIGNTVGVNLGGNFWDRQVYVGVVTPYGAVLAGRQYTPAYEAFANFDTLGTQSSLSAGQVAAIPAGIDIRVSNALSYRMQLGGFSAAAMYGAAEGSTSTGRLAGINAIYKATGYSFGIGHNTRENERGDTSLRSSLIGATMDIGPGRVSALVATIKDDNPTGLSGIAASVTPAVGAANAALIQGAFTNAFKQDGRLSHVGYRLNSGVHTAYVAYSRFDDRRSANADTRSYGVAYSYAFSKRTDVNAVVTRFDNSGFGQAAPGGAGYIGGFTASAGTDSTGLALGLRHRF
jgi:predicted porin